MSRKIYILGETTYDIIFKDEKPIDAKVGGSQLNTAVSLGRLGIPVNFVSQIGNDKVGDISVQFLAQNNISLDNISRYDSNSRVALAFLNENNNAEYTFLKPNIKGGDIKFPEIEADDIILFGSSYAIKEDIREDLYSFLKEANKKNAIIVYDPNFRSSNLNKLDKLKPMMEQNFSVASIVKGSDEDFFNIFNTQNSTLTHKILKDAGTLNLLYTMGKKGVYLHTEEMSKTFKVPKIIPVSTIGAGDNFNAGIIFSLIKQNISHKNINRITEDQWDELVRNAINFSQNVCMSYENYVSLGFAEQYK